MSKRLSISVFALALVACALPLSAQSAYVYAVHGIPGMNGFPVDVAVNGTCVLPNFTFGAVAGPLSLPPATYTVTVHVPANSANPCSEPAALTATPSLVANNTYALAAHLTEAGTPVLAGFGIDLSRTSPGTGRFILHHTAKAPSVDVAVNRGEGQGKAPSAAIPGFANGAQVAAEFRPGDWYATLSAGGTPVFGPTLLNLAPKTAQLVFAVGVFPDTFTYIVKTIPIM